MLHHVGVQAVGDRPHGVFRRADDFVRVGIQPGGSAPQGGFQNNAVGVGVNRRYRLEMKNWKEFLISRHTSQKVTRQNRTPTLQNRCQ